MVAALVRPRSLATNSATTLPWKASFQAVRRKPSKRASRSGKVRVGEVADPEMCVRPASVMIWRAAVDGTGAGRADDADDVRVGRQGLGRQGPALDGA